MTSSSIHCAPDTFLYDTRKHGKPDLVKLAIEKFDVEAVGIISNQHLTEKLVYDLTSHGIPTYGAVFDS